MEIIALWARRIYILVLTLPPAKFVVQWLRLHAFTAGGHEFSLWSGNWDPCIPHSAVKKKFWFLALDDVPGGGIRSPQQNTEPGPRLLQSFVSVQFSSVPQSCPTLCDPMNHSTPGLPVHHQLPEFTQTHAHQVSDAIQPSHPLLSPSPPAPNLFQHQGLF